MKQTELSQAVSARCPIRQILSRICEKWPLLIIYTLHAEGVMRFSSLQRGIPDISQKMLTSTLKKLEEDGLLSRQVYAEVPPRVEYTLTERGRSLVPLLENLIEWAKEHMEEILEQRISRSSGF